VNEVQFVSSVVGDVWDTFVAVQPDAHVLQTSAWGALKARFGWTGERVGLTGEDGLVAGAQVLYRRLPVGLGHLAYVPKGPLVDWTDEEQIRALLMGLDRAAGARGAIALTVEPDLLDESLIGSACARWVFIPPPSMPSSPAAPSSSISPLTRKRSWRR
jgi:lipid II:glycine glycyltransferase (peptidoglycan interpeptide bridge formation enzyme)